MSAPDARVLGAYRLLDRVGKGGMGEVYRAEHLRLGREAAVKVLPRALAGEAEFLARFEREAASAASLNHPNILAVWDYGEQDETPYLVMPYVRGGTLKDRLERGPLTTAELTRALVQLANALDYAHEYGIVHRDVKPANMLLNGDGHLYLADFGVAKALEGSEGLTRTGIGVGTPEYMAPEQARGQADTRSDLYALGIVLYQMLTGRVPYTGGSTVEVLMKHLQEPLPLEPLRHITPPPPRGMEEVLRKALAKNPDERYQTGRELVEAYQSLTATVAPPASRPGATPPPAAPGWVAGTRTVVDTPANPGHRPFQGLPGGATPPPGAAPGEQWQQTVMTRLDGNSTTRIIIGVVAAVLVLFLLCCFGLLLLSALGNSSTSAAPAAPVAALLAG